MAETPYHRVGLSADAIRMGITGGIRIQNDMSKPIVDGFAAYDDAIQKPLGYITKDGERYRNGGVAGLKDKVWKG